MIRINEHRGRLGELALTFLRLGITSFGGPSAHIAMMNIEFVQKKQWLTQEEFLDLLGATNLIPGPNSTEMAIHIGKERAGWRGLMVAGLCFIVPSVVLTAIIAVFYSKYGQLPAFQSFIFGIKPAIIGIILASIYPLAQKSVKNSVLLLLGIFVLSASLLGYNEILLLFGAGFMFLFKQMWDRKTNPNLKFIFPFFTIPSVGLKLTVISNLQVFWIFLKIGSILYGSGYVLFAFLDGELVAKGYLTRPQLMDAIAVGQFTPGPVFSSVTFIGYQMKGWMGAFLATTGIFLPAFVFVALLNPIVKKMRSSAFFAAFLDAVNVASIAIIFSVCIQMGADILYDWRSVLIFILSTGLLFGIKKVNNVWVIIFGALLGYLLLQV